MENEQLTEEQLYYKDKYLKYKLKYLSFKKQYGGEDKEKEAAIMNDRHSRIRKYLNQLLVTNDGGLQKLINKNNNFSQGYRGYRYYIDDLITEKLQNYKLYNTGDIEKLLQEVVNIAKQKGYINDSDALFNYLNTKVVSKYSLIPYYV
jgi:SOS response regulatory protein OraA/RecX